MIVITMPTKPQIIIIGLIVCSIGANISFVTFIIKLPFFVLFFSMFILLGSWATPPLEYNIIRNYLQILPI